MTQYRDETETLRARVAELEGKLAVSEAEAARLRGEAATPVADAKRDAIVGEQLHFVDELELPYTLTPEGYEAIANLVRSRRNVQVSQVGRALTAPGFSLTAGEGWTHIRLETDLRNARLGVLISGPLLSGLFAGLPATGVVLDMSSRMGTSPWHLAWLLPSVLAGGFFGMRALVRRTVGVQRASHEGTLAGIRELVEKHRAAPITKVRVEAPADAEPETTAADASESEQAEDEAAEVESRRARTR